MACALFEVVGLFMAAYKYGKAKGSGLATLLYLLVAPAILLGAGWVCATIVSLIIGMPGLP